MGLIRAIYNIPQMSHQFIVCSFPCEPSYLDKGDYFQKVLERKNFPYLHNRCFVKTTKFISICRFLYAIGEAEDSLDFLTINAVPHFLFQLGFSDDDRYFSSCKSLSALKFSEVIQISI